ncbi:hypothetical protein [Krasilnikovia sp. M28-CT-15]|uniref:hypothetical protein n=1 Tax=Krasilnikovia sp. M28-CT-15 TaxID=3373540 RepID=UPI0038763F76
MSSLPDAERDASEVVRALAGLAALIRRYGIEPGDEASLLLTLAEDGGAAAERVLEYLQAVRGPGDGVAALVPPRIGPWREWVPPRGHLFGARDGVTRPDGVPNQPRRSDPGE